MFQEYFVRAAVLLAFVPLLVTQVIPLTGRNDSEFARMQGGQGGIDLEHCMFQPGIGGSNADCIAESCDANCRCSSNTMDELASSKHCAVVTGNLLAPVLAVSAFTEEHFVDPSEPKTLSPMFELLWDPSAYAHLSPYRVPAATGNDSGKISFFFIICSGPWLPVCSASIVCSGIVTGACSGGVVCLGVGAGACSGGVVCSGALTGGCSGGVICSYSTSASACSVSIGGCSAGAGICSANGAGCSGVAVACSANAGACSGGAVACSFNLVMCSGGAVFCSLNAGMCTGGAVVCSVNIEICSGGALICSGQADKICSGGSTICSGSFMGGACSGGFVCSLTGGSAACSGAMIACSASRGDCSVAYACSFSGGECSAAVAVCSTADGGCSAALGICSTSNIVCSGFILPCFVPEEAPGVATPIIDVCRRREQFLSPLRTRYSFGPFCNGLAESSFAAGTWLRLLSPIASSLDEDPAGP